LGVTIADVAPRSVAGRLAPRPVFLIHGDADALTPVEHSRELYGMLGEPKELWIVEGAAHVEASTIAPDEYFERVVAFFGRYLGGASEDAPEEAAGAPASHLYTHVPSSE